MRDILSFRHRRAGGEDRQGDQGDEAGLAADHPATVAAKMIRLKLLNVKAELERELGRLVLTAATASSQRWGTCHQMEAPDRWLSAVEGPARAAAGAA